MDADPFTEFDKWYSLALRTELILPNAMALATVNPQGKPSIRMVLLKSFDKDGFVFYTNYESQKAVDLESNPHAALLFYWSSLGRQVRISGTTVRTTHEESEAYFRTRPFDSRVSTWVSRQSEPVSNRDQLEQKMAELMTKYQDGEVPLPAYWGGYRLKPDTFEFWQNRHSRLHDRIRYHLVASGDWAIGRLQP